MSTIILADDHQILRDALRLLLETQPDFQVLAESGDGAEAVRLVEKHRPDILIADMMMPGYSGLEVARQVRQISPATRVIILSMYEAESYVVDALKAGIAGYVLKKSSSQDLVYAIHQALQGNIYLSPSINELAIHAYMERAQQARMDDPYATLTPREREVFLLAAQGLSNPKIAKMLSLSARTVEDHRGKLLKKLGVKTQTELVKFAIQRGLI